MRVTVKGKITQDGEGEPWTIKCPALDIDAQNDHQETAQNQLKRAAKSSVLAGLGPGMEIVITQTVITYTFTISKRKDQSLDDFRTGDQITGGEIPTEGERKALEEVAARQAEADAAEAEKSKGSETPVDHRGKGPRDEKGHFRRKDA
jgi:hypothetical protein